MARDVNEKNVWITGGSSGIGAALAENFSRRGWNVNLTARSSDRLEALKKEIEIANLPGAVFVHPGDVTDASVVKRIVHAIETKTGAIDLAILNAGIDWEDHIERFSADDFRKVFDINVQGVVNALDPVLAAMRERKSGHIAIVASMAGYRGVPGAASYSASKAALVSLAESLACEAVDYNIKIQVINPGFVKTPMTESNNFNMPFLISARRAADYIEEGLYGAKFAIEFPWQMAWGVKLICMFPHRIYAKIMRKLFS